ncbi:MAG: 50S ribosomal protein L9 [bacterium]
MKIILRKDVSNLGSAGDVKEVAGGYGRNFLIPRGLAESATSGAVKAWKAGEEKRAKRSVLEMDKAREVADKLSGMSLSFSRPVGEEGRIFGSVGKSDILKSLKASGHEISKDCVKLPASIKTVGEAEVEITLKPGISATVKVKVSPRGR